MISRPPFLWLCFLLGWLLVPGNAGINGICGLGKVVQAFSYGNVFGVLLMVVWVYGCFAFLFGYGRGRLCGAWDEIYSFFLKFYTFFLLDQKEPKNQERTIYNPFVRQLCSTVVLV